MEAESCSALKAERQICGTLVAIIMIVRATLVLTFALLITACKPTVDLKYLLGKWTARDVIPNCNMTQKVEGYIQYFDNDSTSSVTIVDGDTMYQVPGRYHIDTVNLQLNIFINDSSASFKILHLTKSELDLLDLKTNIAARYIRP